MQAFVYSDRTTKPSPVSALCSQIHRSLAIAMPLLRVWVHCRRASNGLLPRRSNLVGYVRWDARSDQFLLARQSFQQLFRSQFALPPELIPRVLSCEGPRKRLPAFASGDVVGMAAATGIHVVTTWHSLLFLSHSRSAMDPPCGVSTLCRERYGYYPASVGVTRYVRCSQYAGSVGLPMREDLRASLPTCNKSA